MFHNITNSFHPTFTDTNICALYRQVQNYYEIISTLICSIFEIRVCQLHLQMRHKKLRCNMAVAYLRKVRIESSRNVHKIFSKA